ncbi:hypothetical protein K2Z83_21335 [Oscillochloris sp. ZM17-4]|uniref:hypothetical protein n=1 Tax=Oscillochloris sp. ZM17-4 TaxID=2866714 RepID=UPI001C72E7A3|nr:hypothetical protein [Oscillochloris sp. ZM17-4]MBX0330217.1 hypothetical protein [Oscillochloris sp. ZM17-4]
MTTSPVSKRPRALLGAEEMRMVAAYLQQSPLLPFEIVAQMTSLDPALLRKLVRDGVLAGEAPFRVQRVVGNCEVEGSQRIAARLQKARTALDGQAIRPSDAAEKYGFHRDNIYSWLKKGWVRQVEGDPSGEIFVDEGDIAVARALADIVGQGRGKPVFPKGDGPYKVV